MAGIGFELKKLFDRETMTSSIVGSIYAAFSTLGASVFFAIILLSIRLVMDNSSIAETESTFFVSSTTYVFLSVILVSASFNNVLSRYISDCIFQKRDSDISAAVFGSIAMSSLVEGVFLSVYCILMYFVDGIEIEFIILFYMLGVLTISGYILMTFLSALKEYKNITYSFLIGMIFAIMTFFILMNVAGFHIIIASYTALAVGFFVIVFFLINCCLKAFGRPSDKYFEFLKYFKKYPLLVVSGLSYMIGFYISSIIYWFFSDMSVVSGVFRTAPLYDLAVFLAVVINLPSLVIFMVKVETVFYGSYVEYISAINNEHYSLIEKARKKMVSVIQNQLFFLYEVQLVITLVLICVINVSFPYLNISAQSLNMFLLIGMGLYCTFCMNFTTIFLYYFEDYKSACAGPITFVVIVTLLSIYTVIFNQTYYPIPILVGGVVSWIISYVALGRRMKAINGFLMCK
ncbi:MAG: exopolysaccharide Pel transporter PelG [Suipraeoptans sp.]